MWQGCRFRQPSTLLELMGRIFESGLFVADYNMVDSFVFYSGLTLNQYGVASPCRTICTVCGFVALS